jgi:excisionase family DNA binding protein
MPHRKKTTAVSAVAIPTTEPLCVPIPVAAKMLGTTVRAVRSLLWSRKLPHLKLGKRFVIPVAELRTFVQRSAA